MCPRSLHNDLPLHVFTMTETQKSVWNQGRLCNTEFQYQSARVWTANASRCLGSSSISWYSSSSSLYLRCQLLSVSYKTEKNCTIQFRLICHFFSCVSLFYVNCFLDSKGVASGFRVIWKTTLFAWFCSSCANWQIVPYTLLLLLLHRKRSFSIWKLLFVSWSL